ncbi:hypothetical protein K435DRAFT_699725 [Dendrothele bispora CBS 962.96]|uniref:Uncharacterized protein n=1 Tax=Dendrothele bispora (strain CBS 962.96) TaxID=1314807 RepID=A0A4S8KS47_DENBC|nr:hypothetical protein K435DRAFT_699725 [Dendrothele bispora CBS 962.96]
MPLIDRNNIIFGCVAPPPNESQNSGEWIHQVNEEAIAALERERDGAGLSFKPTEKNHRRGTYFAKADGVSAGGGQAHPKRIYHSKKTAAALNRLRHERAFIKVAGHASAVFAHWSPKLFNYYGEVMDKLKANDPSLTFNFPNSIFACCTYNLGPRTIAVEHLDHLNYIYGWCSITSFGRFNYKKGGHLILWDLKLVIEFPPCWTILIPSSYLIHSNTCISLEETRYSFTQYTAGALFRYVDDGFRMRTEMEDDIRKEAQAMQRDRIQEDLNIYSTLDDLKFLYNI